MSGSSRAGIEAVLATPGGSALAIHVVREDGSTAGQLPAVVDWEPAHEWVRLTALRQGRTAEQASSLDATLRPLWDTDLGAPYLEGFRATAGAGEEHVCADFPVRYFRDAAHRAVTELTERTVLVDGDRVHWRVLAFGSEPTAAPAGHRRFRTRARRVSWPVREGSLAEWLTRATASSTLGGEADPPLFVPVRVLEEAASCARSVPGRETGGVLIGHLRRDVAAAEVFLEVTAQIPARHTEADATRLTFTPETWSAVQRALTLRGRDEIMLGWWHSHPVREWCAGCPPERQRQCVLAREFFSPDDRALHRTVFPRAYSIALVVNDVAGGPTFSLFGWRAGLIEPRGFHVLGDVQADTPALAARGVVAADTKECEHVS